MSDKEFLVAATTLAEKSDENLKCGSILVDSSGQIVAQAYNSQHADGLVASHAEMKAIAVANRKTGRKLHGVTAYGNCEPCTMCLTAMIFAGVERVVFVHRLNDLVRDDQKTTIDCYEFLRHFPQAPKLEQISL